MSVRSDRSLMDHDDFETALKDKETEVDDLSRQVAEMKMKMDRMQSAQFRAAMMEEQLKKQGEDYDTRLRVHVEENRRLHKDLDNSRERERIARTSTPSRPPYTPTPTRYVAGDRTSFGQEDIFAISQVISGTNAEMMKQMLDHTDRQQETFYSSMNVPVTPLQTFEGDPTKFYTFMKRFDEVVHSSKKNVASKLNTLIAHCGEDVKPHIDCCNYKDAESGYQLARSILKRRYGNPYVVSQAWVEKLVDFPKLKTGELISRFVGELSSAHETLRTLGFLSELECTRSMRQLVAKLPTYVQNRWRRIHREKVESEGTARLKDLIAVISEASLEMNDPVYGPESMDKVLTPDVKSKSGAVKKKVSINAASLTPRGGKSMDRGGQSVRLAKFPCKVCSDQRHYTYQCYVYRDFTPEERLEFVETNKLCYLCLNDSHRVSTCDRTYVCQYPGCQARHNTTLHRALEKKKSGVDKMSVMTGEAEELEDDGGALDEVSESDFQLALGAKPIATSEFILQGINGERIITADVIEFSLRGTAGADSLEAFNVIVNPEMTFSQKHARQLRQYEQWPHLRHLNIIPAERDTIELLIGQNNAHLFKGEDRVDGSDQYAPYGVLTPLGWTVFGNLTDKLRRYRRTYEVMCNKMEESPDVQGLLEKMWEVDQVPEAVKMSPVNKKIVDDWNKEFALIDGHVQLSLPFKNVPPNLPDNRRPVEAQLRSLKKRLERDPVVYDKYCQTMKTNLDRGFTEKVTTPPEQGYENFVPQFRVITDRRPGKCRIVGNASFIYQSSSLNQSLHQGPNLTGDLVEIMIEFRVHPVVVTADIEQMYNQVKVPPIQRDALKLLWWPEGDLLKEPEEYRMTTQMFGLISSPAAAMHALQEGVRRYGEDMAPETIQAALKNFYVDDLIKSIVNVEVGIRLVRELKVLLARIGFNLTKFGSNSLEILETITEQDRAAPYRELEFALSESNTDKTLGSIWGPQKDVFIFMISLVEKPDTRRGMLSTFASVFDPLGLVGPIILRAKMLIQRICRLKYDWDQELDDDVGESWREWKTDIQSLTGFSVPRWLRVEQEKEQEYRVHVFADASELGFGAVAYLSVTEAGKRQAENTLVMSKARVAPIKQMSIPRLELSAAVLAVKLAKVVETGVQVPLKATIFWSDSTIALHYILSQSRVFKTFVANRVSYIQDHTDPDQWRHVSGVQNIADVASRGCQVQELRDNHEWIHGPDFLKSTEMWPAMPDVFDQSALGGLPEYRPVAVNVSTAMGSHHLLKSRTSLMNDLVDHYSSWKRLIKGVGYWKKFFQFLKDRKRFRPGFTPLEYREVEETVIRFAQEELRDLDRFKDPVLKKLYTFDADGIIRVGGRLMMANLEYEERYPAVLPAGRVAELYVLHKHNRLGHPGVDRTYMETRKRMWIISGRRFIKSSLEGCIMCHRLRSKAAAQQMAPLPHYRVDICESPFQRVGVDFFGPVYVRQGRATVKRYGCAITCLASRAFHVEPVSDLSTSAFLNALQRFIARRGKPLLIVSDNGTNFVGARNELKDLMKQWNKTVVSDYLIEEGIEWRFNTPTASHHGGVWERQIRSVRTIMMAIVKNQVLTDESFHTYLCMVEQVINSRPLTKLTEDPSDELPLTPQHFLTLHRAAGIAGKFTSSDDYRRKWKHIQHLSDQYWQKWSASYLKDLQVRTKWEIPYENFKVGDLALYMKQDCGRLDWPMALITHVHRGKDGKVRSVTIKTRDGVYDRPITRLIRLEVDK